MTVRCLKNLDSRMGTVTPMDVRREIISGVSGVPTVECLRSVGYFPSVSPSMMPRTSSRTASLGLVASTSWRGTSGSRMVKKAS